MQLLGDLVSILVYLVLITYFKMKYFDTLTIYTLQHISNVVTLLYRHFIICLYKYVTMYCKDTFCGTLERVTCIDTLFEVF
jgi:hypothetical protein